jgi:predicted porin
MTNTLLKSMHQVALAGLSATLFCLNAPAFAQSSIQLNGLVDEWAGIQKLPGGKQAFVASDNGMSVSYWGLKGSEDLGNNYKAIFALESFFRPETGQVGSFPGDVFLSRNAYVGLETPYGTLTTGRLATQLLISTILFNPLADAFGFSPIIYQTFLGFGTYPAYTTDQGALGGTDWDNAVQYSSPVFGGLSGSVMYALGNTAGQNGAKKYSAQILYFQGPFAATAVYQYVNFNDTAGDLSSLVSGLQSQGLAQVGVSYDLKFVKLFTQYMYTHNAQEGGGWHVNTVQTGISIPLGVGTASASFAYSRDHGGLDESHPSAAVGYDYPLSKRTDVYVTYLYDRIVGLSSGYTGGAGIRMKF